ncbi:Hypothetical predicted protein [Olea europaea subsp. europaea]|uniref:DUF1985 domain-containing protein n=1 Tax=Olea europaea subsp. europaea TaxID=158383 RepID=A0A8S0PBE6_OLEEU|nr:Hypothetical predicted protein [Olea europaea subsp. europaea]
MIAFVEENLLYSFSNKPLVPDIVLLVHTGQELLQLEKKVEDLNKCLENHLDRGQMEFDFCIPKYARLRAHILQWNNLKYVKTVMDHFDDRQREDFCNSPFRYLAKVPEIQFSAQLIQQLVFRTIRIDKVNELWFSVQGNLMRFGLQEYTLVTGLRCSVFPVGDDFDRVLERRLLKERVGYRRLLHGFQGFWAKKFQKTKRRQEKEITYTIHDFPIAMQVWAYEAVPEIGEHFGQQVGERMPRLLSWSARKQPQHRTTVVRPQFNASHASSGSGGQLARQDSDDGVSSGGSAEDETSGDGDGDGSQTVIATVTIPRIVARTPVSDPATVRIPAEDRRVRLPHLGRHTFLLQCEGRRWRHGQFENLDQASPEGRWKSCCWTKESSLKCDSGP